MVQGKESKKRGRIAARRRSHETGLAPARGIVAGLLGSSVLWLGTLVVGLGVPA